MKKTSMLTFLFTIILMSITTSSVFAHSDKDHKPCTTPAQSTEYESKDPWSSYYTYQAAKHKWIPDVRWVSGSSWTDEKGERHSSNRRNQQPESIEQR